jgi:hypothetical protein
MGPSPFEVAQTIGNKTAAAFQKSEDSNAIQKILAEASKSGNPEDLNKAMSKILSQVSPERQPMAVKYLQNQYEMLQNKQQSDKKRQASINAGLDPDLDPALQKEQYKANQNRRMLDEILKKPGSGKPQPGGQPQPGSALEDPSLERDLRSLSEDQLIAIQGVPGPHQKPAEQELKRRQKAHTEDRADERESKKEVRESFKDNEDFINKTYDQYEDSLRKEATLEKMDDLSDETSESGVINALRALGMEDEWLQNPANEEYAKLGLDLLGGGTLQADYGSRVLQSEFMVSQKRIPELRQTKEGRKQIIENYKAMLLPSRLKFERMKYYLDQQERTGEPLPHNLRGKILRDIQPQLQESYDKFKQRNGRYKVKEGTPIDANAVEKYYYMAMDKKGKVDQDKVRKMMEEDGYRTK